eukprot:scaffold1975_cov54-Attheya_sp.AAC.2
MAIAVYQHAILNSILQNPHTCALVLCEKCSPPPQSLTALTKVLTPGSKKGKKKSRVSWSQRIENALK